MPAQPYRLPLTEIEWRRFSAMARQSFSADNSERRGVIGSTDWASIFDLPPYGCLRRAWYETGGVEPDYPEDPSQMGVFERGRWLEPYILYRYERESGKRLRPFRRKSRTWRRRHGVPDWWRAHPDAVCPDGTPVEAKSVAEAVLRQWLYDGIPEQYILQAQAHCVETGSGECVFLALCLEDWRKFLQFPVARDEGLIRRMREEGERFMASLGGEAPERPEHCYGGRSLMCRRCRWRRRCWEEEEDFLAEQRPINPERPELADLSDAEPERFGELYRFLHDVLFEYAEVKQVADDAAERIEDIRARVMERLLDAGVGKCRVDGASVSVSKKKDGEYSLIIRLGKGG